ncbi:hypothetical protein [Terrisporobacter sp.]|uniref:hypothetical protein n=1 Tax=Terrisporobacter sp. TaxID=1965305 RepID=UPI0026387E69|nr:hypothetical protein [Terrisporobacter sp.]
MERFLNAMCTAIEFVFVCILTMAFIIVPPSVIINVFGFNVFSVLASLFWLVIAIGGIILGLIEEGLM